MKINYKQALRWVYLSTISGILAGLSSALFLSLLSLSTRTRQDYNQIIYLLPFAGLVIGFAYDRFGGDSHKGNNLILDEIHSPKKVVPLRMVPFVLFGTLLTHLFGGSAGREGTAVQMSAALSDQLSKFFKLTAYERKVMLIAGSGAGLGAAISAPWAGVIFGMEIITVGKMKLFAIFQCLIASFIGYSVVQLLGVPHTYYPDVEFITISLNYIPYLIGAGILFGVTANSFARLTHFITKMFKRIIPNAPLRPFLGGCFLLILYKLEGSYNYTGLGISEIQSSLQTQAPWTSSFFKLVFTALTLGSGFKGGEFTPLVFIGATLGSALAVLTPIPFPILAALGFISVFGAAANAPLTCIIMGIEVFGIEILPYAVISCYISYYFSGHNGIYESQEYFGKKHRKAFILLNQISSLVKNTFRSSK